MPRADGKTRDRSCVEHMLRYCEQIDETLGEIGHDRVKFMQSHTYQNAVAMCILQIGELTKQLTAEFVQANSQIPWSLIAKTRDTYAHHYGVTDFELVWATAVEDIPMVAAFCREYLRAACGEY